MKKIKYFIIGIVLLIIIVVITIVAINMKDRKENPEAYQYIDENTITEEGREQINYRKALNDVNSPDDFFTAVNCVNQYITAVNRLSITNENTSGEAKNGLRKNVYEMLSKDYISDNNITQGNVDNYLNDVSNSVYFIPLRAKSIQDDNFTTTRYIIYGIEEDMNYNFLRDLYIIVNTDNTNKTFSIEPIINHNYTNIDDVKLDSKKITIEKNNVNEIIKVVASDEYTSQQYLLYYKYLAIGRPDIAYEFLDKEYREKRFGSLEKYQQYIQDNLDDVKAVKLGKYGVDRQKEYNQYVCQDTYGKMYVFNVEKPMDFSLQLDIYTIESDEYKEQYETGNEEIKVQMNVNKFILMINNQDYETAYNLLDENFKNNYFKTLEDFINYMKVYAYKYNNVEIRNFNVNGNVYICEGVLTDATNGQYVDETKGTAGSGSALAWTFYMQLGDGEDFKISFEVL